MTTRLVALSLFSVISTLGCSIFEEDKPQNGACPALTGAVAEGKQYGATISTSQTWTAADSPHIIDQAVTIDDGAVITVEPCAVVKLKPGRDITVRGGSKLVARGTPEKPIVFDSYEPASPNATNEWGHLLARASDGKVGFIDLANVTLDHGGQLDCSVHCFPTGGVLQATGNDVQNDGFALIPALNVEHVRIQNTPSSGFQLTTNVGFTSTSTDLTVTKAASEVAFAEMRNVGTIPVGSYTGNAMDKIVLKFGGGTVKGDLTLPDRGLPYILDEGSLMAIGGDTPAEAGSLTIEPGVTLKVGYGFTFSVDTTGSFVAKGTAAKPILITSSRPTPAAGDWSGIGFEGSTTSVLDHVTLEYTGGGYNGRKEPVHCSTDGVTSLISHAAITFTKQPEKQFITNSTFRAVDGFGINLGYVGTPVDFMPTNTFLDVAKCKQTTPVLPGYTCPATVTCP